VAVGALRLNGWRLREDGRWRSDMLMRRTVQVQSPRVEAIGRKVRRVRKRISNVGVLPTTRRITREWFVAFVTVLETYLPFHRLLVLV
jgi:hypothetical protein